MIIISEVLTNHFNIPRELCDDIIDLIIASEDWELYKDKDKWTHFALTFQNEPDDEDCKDLIDWLAERFPTYLKLKIFL